VLAGRVVDRATAGVEERIVLESGDGSGDCVEGVAAGGEDVPACFERARKAGPVRLGRRPPREAGAAVDREDRFQRTSAIFLSAARGVAASACGSSRVMAASGS
jgi:hypothetical protein